MRSSPIGSRGAAPGGALVAVDTDLDALVDQLAGVAAVAVDDELGAVAREVTATAVAGWPVVTGRSRAGLSFSRHVAPDGETEYRIRGAASYTDRIVQAGQTPYRLADRLLRAPLRERVAVALTRIGAKVRR